MLLTRNATDLHKIRLFSVYSYTALFCLDISVTKRIKNLHYEIRILVWRHLIFITRKGQAWSRAQWLRSPKSLFESIKIAVPNPEIRWAIFALSEKKNADAADYVQFFNKIVNCQTKKKVSTQNNLYFIIIQNIWVKQYDLIIKQLQNTTINKIRLKQNSPYWS